MIEFLLTADYADFADLFLPQRHQDTKQNFAADYADYREKKSKLVQR
jgi:hypothetical protein